MDHLAANLWAVSWRCLLLFVVFILAVVAGASTEQAMAPGETPAKALLLEAIPFTGLLIGTLLLMRLVPPAGIDAGLATAGAVPQLVIGLLIGLAWMGATLLIVAAIGDLRIDPQKMNLSAATALAALALLANVAMQQLLTRGYMFGVIDWKFGSVAAIAFTSLVFLALHPGAFAAGGIAIANVLMVGVIFGLARALTGSLYFAAGLHFAWNFVGAVVLGLIPLSAYPTLRAASMTGNRQWIGGAQGIETGLAVTITNAILMLGLLALIWRKMPAA